MLCRVLGWAAVTSSCVMKESLIVRQILDYLNAKRVFNFRLNSGIIFGQHKGKQWAFRAHTLGTGVADICVPSPGTLWIEVKNEKGKQSIEQKEFEQMVTKLGHRYILARSIDDLEGVI